MNFFGKHFWRNRSAAVGLVLMIIITTVGLLAPWLAPYDPMLVHEGAYRLPPVWAEGGQSQFLLGTDDVGRDLLSRLLYGARVSLGVGFLVVVLSLIVGVTLGILAGYFGGWLDTLIMRFVDVLMSLPSILLALVIVAILGPSLINGIFAVSVVALPGFIRIVRASFLAEKQKTYVSAVIGFGASHGRIAIRNILPNTFAPIIVQATLGFSDGILNVAALGFLGMGAQPPTPEWGVMLADSKAYIESAPWQVTLPGICILIAVLAFNVLGDGLRDILDPRLRGL